MDTELDPPARQALAAIGGRSARRETLLAVADGEDVTKAALAREFGLSTNAVRERLQTLLNVGVVEKVVDEPDNPSAARPYRLTERGETVAEVLRGDGE